MQKYQISTIKFQYKNTENEAITKVDTKLAELFGVKVEVIKSDNEADVKDYVEKSEPIAKKIEESEAAEKYNDLEDKSPLAQEQTDEVKNLIKDLNDLTNG